MNCKPGDLAIVVRSNAGNLGRIVRCIRLATEAEADQVNFWSGALWHIDVELQAHRHGRTEWRTLRYCPDECLRPIRPQSDDATDEMVLRVGRPEGVPA